MRPSSHWPNGLFWAAVILARAPVLNERFFVPLAREPAVAAFSPVDPAAAFSAAFFAAFLDFALRSKRIPSRASTYLWFKIVVSKSRIVSATAKMATMANIRKTRGKRKQPTTGRHIIPPADKPQRLPRHRIQKDSNIKSLEMLVRRSLLCLTRPALIRT